MGTVLDSFVQVRLTMSGAAWGLLTRPAEIAWEPAGVAGHERSETPPPLGRTSYSDPRTHL